MLSALLASYMLAYVDRIMLNLLVEPIKRDLGLTDVAISMLQGFSFAFTMAIAALPVAHLVDTRRRTAVLAVAIVGWSVGTAICGLADGFEVLLAGRMIVAVGEAAMIPCAYSMIGDLFARERQGRAISIFSMGSYAGSAAALVFGAAILQLVSAPADPWIDGVPPWQISFLVTGIVGLPLALWVFSLPEPQRFIRPARALPPFRMLWRQLQTHTNTLICLHLGTGFLAMGGHSLMAWLPTHLVRRFEMSVQEAGFAVGLALIVAGPSGALIAGLAGDRLRMHRQPLGRLPIVLVGATVSLVSLASMLLMSSVHLAIGLLLPTILGFAIALSTSPAAIQDVTSRVMFGAQHALASLCATIGLGLGPTIVALLTDRVFRDESYLGVSLLIACPTMLLAALISYGAATHTYASMLSGVRD